jgi:hypothetical protein
MAVDEINAQEASAPGRRQTRPGASDAGDSVQKATSAAQRALSGGGCAAQGSWLSSFTRALPKSPSVWCAPLTHLADKITDRGLASSIVTGVESPGDKGIAQAAALARRPV